MRIRRMYSGPCRPFLSCVPSGPVGKGYRPAAASSFMPAYVWSRTRSFQRRSSRYPPSLPRLAMAASRAAGFGGTYQTPVPPDAVAPLVPQ